MGGRRYWYPDLGVSLTIQGPDAQAVPATIGWSETYQVLHPAGPVTVPFGWKRVSFDGVDFQVPPSWPVKQLSLSRDANPGSCSQREFATAQVDEGTGFEPPCPLGITNYAAGGRDGVWVRSYDGPWPSQDPAATLLETDPSYVYVTTDDPTPSMDATPLLSLIVGRGGSQATAIDIGIGPDISVAQEVAASLTDAAGAPLLSTILPSS